MMQWHLSSVARKRTQPFACLDSVLVCPPRKGSKRTEASPPALLLMPPVRPAPPHLLPQGPPAIAQPDCLAFPYLKTMGAVVLALLRLREETSDRISSSNGTEKAKDEDHRRDREALPPARGARSPPRRILCIGLGGGSLPLFLAHHLPGVQARSTTIAVILGENVRGRYTDVNIAATTQPERTVVPAVCRSMCASSILSS